MVSDGTWTGPAREIRVFWTSAAKKVSYPAELVVISVRRKSQSRGECDWNEHPTPLHRWVNSLQPARVTRWGGMISTPDAVLQAVIKRSLVESGCPASIVNELIENAHERSWPQGLATLETRQMNRRYYENYVAKRIPGKQAVVVMACENQHMGDDMVQEPGLVMIFAHGVEEI